MENDYKAIIIKLEEENVRIKAELVVSNNKLIFEAEEKAKRAAELIFANKEKIFSAEETVRIVEELAVSNKELIFKVTEKAERAAELIIANKELVFQESEKSKRAEELIVVQLQKEEFEKMNKLLSFSEKKLNDKITELEKMNSFMSNREVRMAELKNEIKILNLQVLDLVGDQMFIVNKKYQYIFVNKSFADNVKGNINNILGKEISDFYPKEISQKFINNIDEVIKTGQSKRNINEKVTIGDVSFEINTSLDPIFGSKEEGVVAVVGVSRKIG